MEQSKKPAPAGEGREPERYFTPRLELVGREMKYVFYLKPGMEECEVMSLAARVTDLLESYFRESE